MVIATFAVVLILALFGAAWIRASRRGGPRRPRVRRGPGPGAAGAVYELLNEDRRRALEIIVEERAEATDPESKDGNLPDLERPGRS
jgi:hypothetical protein